MGSFMTTSGSFSSENLVKHGGDRISNFQPLKPWQIVCRLCSIVSYLLSRRVLTIQDNLHLVHTIIEKVDGEAVLINLIEWTIISWRLSYLQLVSSCFLLLDFASLVEVNRLDPFTRAVPSHHVFALESFLCMLRVNWDYLTWCHHLSQVRCIW